MNNAMAGMVTGIGSLPYKEPDPALPLIFANMPLVPHWPQLPRRSKGEGLILQFLGPLVQAGLLVIQNNTPVFDTNNPLWEEKLGNFYALYRQAEQDDKKALDAFALPSEAAVGFYAFLDYAKQCASQKVQYYKGHLTGPLTMGFLLKDAAGNIAYYQDQLRDILVKTLALHARWQAEALASLGRNVVIFVDEPAVGVYGSPQHPNLTKEQVIQDLQAIFQQVHQVGGLVGVHSCDGVDWSLLFASGADLVNLDAYSYGASLLSHGEALQSFLTQGGLVAWGIVPTNQAAQEETAGLLMDKLINLWDALAQNGVDKTLLQQQWVITPACGVGLLPEELAVHIYQLTREVGQCCKKITGME